MTTKPDERADREGDTYQVDDFIVGFLVGLGYGLLLGLVLL